MSKRWGPSATCTNRPYTGGRGGRPLGPAASDRDRDAEAVGDAGDHRADPADPAARTDGGDHATGNAMSGRCPHGERRVALGEIGDHPRHPGTTAAGHDEIDAPNAGPTETFENPRPGHLVGQLDQHRATAAPHDGSGRDLDHRRRTAPGLDHRHREDDGGEHRHRPSPAAHHQRADEQGRGRDRHVGHPPLAERCSARHARDRPDPPDEQPGRQVQPGRSAPADQAGDDAARQAPHHDRSSRGPREQVGRHRGDRDPAEGGEHDRRHAELGGQGDRRGVGHRTRPREDRRDAGREHQDPRRRRDRQAEADRPDEQGVDQDQRGDREREQPTARRLAPERGGDRGRTGHGDRPQHRRLEPGDQAEHAEHADDEREAISVAQPPGQRGEQGGDEGDVLARHGEQVPQARGAEVVGGERVLPPVVAVHQTDEQGACRPREGPRAGVDRAPEPVGQPGHGRSRSKALDPLHLQDRDDPAIGEPGPSGGSGRARPSTRTRSPARRSARASAAGPRPGLVAVTVDDQVDPQRRTHPFGVGADLGPGVDVVSRQGGQATGGRSGQARREQHHRRDEQAGLAQGEGRRGDRGDDPHRQGERGGGTHPGPHREEHDGPLAHTVTRGRSWSSLAGPIPRTSSSSSTLEKPPERCR